MAVYYVRKSGNDLNSGTSPDQAFATLGKAAGVVAAGDTVYVGAGVYREAITLQASGTNGNPIRWIADVTGEYTGDAGLVVITAWDDEAAASVRAECVNLNDQTYNEFYDFVMWGGSSGAVQRPNAGTDWIGEGVVLDGCVFSRDGTGEVVLLYLQGTAGPTGPGLRIRNCAFLGALRINTIENATVDVNADIIIENCLFLTKAGGASSGNCIHLRATTSNTYGIAGIVIRNCTFVSGGYTIYIRNIHNATHPIYIRNCLAIACDYMVFESGTAVTKYLKNNRLFFTNTYTFGAGFASETGDVSDTSIFSGFLGGFADIPLLRKLGWSPFRPWEPMNLPAFGLADNVIDKAASDVATTADLYDEARPGLRGYDVGAVEARARAERESTVVHGDSYAVKLAGAGYHEVLLPVTAGAHTISVYARRDANYTGNPPKLQVRNIPGQADQEAAMTVGAGTWEQLSVAINPTADGVVRVRLVSEDTGANGACYFDDLAVT